MIRLFLICFSLFFIAGADVCAQNFNALKTESLSFLSHGDVVIKQFNTAFGDCGYFGNAAYYHVILNKGCKYKIISVNDDNYAKAFYSIGYICSSDKITRIESYRKNISYICDKLGNHTFVNNFSFVNSGLTGVYEIMVYFPGGKQGANVLTVASYND